MTFAYDDWPFSESMATPAGAPSNCHRLARAEVPLPFLVDRGDLVPQVVALRVLREEANLVQRHVATVRNDEGVALHPWEVAELHKLGPVEVDRDRQARRRR